MPTKSSVPTTQIGSTSAWVQSHPEPKIYEIAASVARHIYLRQGVGLGALTKVYGGSRRNGVRKLLFG